MNESTTPVGTDEVTSRITQILNPTPQEEDTSVTEEETQLETEGFEAEYEDDQVEADSVEPPKFRVLNPETGEEEYYTGEELADGWMRQKTFTQKTQLLAEQRKEMEAERAKVSQEREQYQQGLQQYLSQPEPQPPSEELFETDPLAYMKAKDDYRDALAQRSQAQAEYQRVEGERMREANLQRQEYLQRESEKLTNLIPEWRDENVATKEKQAIREYGVSLGYSAEEMDSIGDARAIALMRKSLLFDSMTQKGKTKLQRGPEGVATLRPGGQQPQRRLTEFHKAKMKLAKSGRHEDATSAISQILRRSA
jgi:hypothetical protein